jgi:large subunit ribosomal protein L10
MSYVIDTNRKTIQEKIKQVEGTVEEMKNYKTVALLDLKKLPDALLQTLRKRIKEGGGKVKILRKPVIKRVLESNKKLSERSDESKRPVALILTNDSPYQLNKFFKENKKKRAAKVGDVAQADIVVPAGDTDLPPGPALSELKAGGVNVAIKGGKIVVNKDSTVAKAGEKITGPKAKALTTLGVMPFDVMANMIFGFDGTYIYSTEVLGLGDTVNEDLSSCLSQALNFSMNASYPTGQNAELLLADAIRQSVNVALNAEVYSSSSIEQLLTSAIRQGVAMDGVKPSDAPKEEKKEEPEAKAEESAEGSDAPPAEEKK